MEWLSDVYGIKVERIEIPRPGGARYYSVKQTGKGVLHTTEGDGVDSAIATFRAKGFAPHFLTGLGRIVQCRPLWAQASTLHTGTSPFFCNAYAQVQIEQVGHSNEKLWSLADGTLHGTAALMAYLSVPHGDEFAIPLIRPIPSWKDDGSDLKPIPPSGIRWATNNTRRQSRLFFNGPKGWYAHLEVPDQEPTWHWDCGALRWDVVMAAAQALLDDGGDDMDEATVRKIAEEVAEAKVLDILGVADDQSGELLIWVVKGVFDARRKDTRVAPDPFKRAYQYGLDAGNLVPIA